MWGGQVVEEVEDVEWTGRGGGGGGKVEGAAHLAHVVEGLRADEEGHGGVGAVEHLGRVGGRSCTCSAKAFAFT